MPNRLIWYVGDRNPSITETITASGTAVDVSAATVTFNMRAVNSSTLTVDGGTTGYLTDGTDGGVYYNWAANDVDTAGEYLIWWEVTVSSKIQSMHEAIIEIRDHAPQTHTYVELEQAKVAISTTGFNHADGDLLRALTSGSRAVDEICGRRFYEDADATSVRYYTAFDESTVYVDDLVTLTTLETDLTGDGTFESTWTSSDYQLEPINAALDGYPYTQINRKLFGSFYFPPNIPNGVKVTAQFGWAAVPSQVETATMILAGRYMKRVREAPFGVVGVDSMVRLARNDPDVMSLLSPFMKNPGRPIW